MEFTEKKKELILSALTQKKVIRNCSRCGNPEMVIDTSEYQLLGMKRNKTILDINTFKFKPLVSTVCPTCGAVQLYDLTLLIGNEVLSE